MADNADINLGPIDQSKQLIDSIKESIREITNLTKRLGLNQNIVNQQEQEFIDKLKAANSNTSSLNTLKSELESRLQNVRATTDEYANDIGYVNNELNRIVGSISSTSDISSTILKNFKSLRDIAADVRNDRSLTNVMTKEQLEESKKQIVLNQQSLELQVRRASSEIDFNAVSSSISNEQSKISSQLVEQDDAIKSANGKYGGQMSHLQKIRDYKSNINVYAKSTNLSEDEILKALEERNKISSFLTNAMKDGLVTSQEKRVEVEIINKKLEEGKEITREEHGLIRSIINARETQYSDKRKETVDSAQFNKNLLTSKVKEADKVKEIILELKTQGKLTKSNGLDIAEKVSLLDQNKNLLVGLNNTEKLRVLKAIESNKELSKNTTLYDVLNKQITESVNREKELSQTMGLTGGIIKEFSKIPGLSAIFKPEDVKSVTDEIRILNKEAEDKAAIAVNERKTSLLETFTQVQENSNTLTDIQKNTLSEITKRLEENGKLEEGDLETVTNLSTKILESVDFETERKDVLDAIVNLSQDEQDSISEITSKIKNKKVLTEEDLKTLKIKTGINAENLGINDKVLDSIKKQGLGLNINAEKISSLNAAQMAFGKVYANIVNAVTDPAAILAAIGAALVKNSQLTNQFQQELGMSYMNSLKMRNELVNAAGASGDLFINSEKLQKSFFALKETTGVFFDLSSQSAETFTNLTERIGLAGAEAGNLVMLTRLQGKETENVLENLYDTTGAMLQTSKTTASVKDILGDVAKSSKGLQASLASNPQALAKAAIAAREFGSTLSELEGIQKNLLNFETSIEAELKAELLTGKQLNLEKARLAALNNDLKTVGEELKKQNVDLTSFGEMNVLQQEAIAEAMGMNRNDLAETLLRQEMQNKTLKEIRSTMGEQAYEQAKALSAQDKFNAAVAKLKDLFVGVMTALTPVIDILAAVLTPISWIAQGLAKLNELSHGLTNTLIGVAIAAKAIGGNFIGMGNVVGGVLTKTGSLISKTFSANATSGFFSGLKGKFSNLGNTIKQFGSKLTGATPASAAASGASNAAGAAGATPPPTSNGKLLKEKMQNIARGLKAFADPKVIKGGLSLLLVSPGLIALGVASLPLKITEKINGKMISASMRGIASGVASFAKAAPGILPLMGASGALVLLTAGLPGLAGIALLGSPAAIGLAALGTAIAGLTVATPGIPVLLAIGGAAALVGAGLALAAVPLFAAAEILKAIGSVIVSAADAFAVGIKALTTSIIDLTSNVSFSQLAGLAGGLLLLGGSMAILGPLTPAIIAGGVAIGFLSLALIPLGKVINSSLEPLAEIAPKLDLANTSIKGMATGIALLATSLNTLDASKLETLSDFEGNITLNTVSTTDQTTNATDNTLSNLEQLTISATTVTLTGEVVSTVAATNTLEQVSAVINVEPVIPEATPVATEIVPGISVATPPPTTTQETLTTNTENLSTATSNATTNLEKLTTVTANILPTTTSPTQLAPGTAITEVTPVNLEPPTEIVPGISVATPEPETINTSTLESVLTLTTDQINTAIGELEFEKKNRSTNLDTLDIMKAQAALVDMRDGQQDIKTELFSDKSLKIVNALVVASSKITDFIEFTESKEIGEKILGAEISVTGGQGIGEEKVKLIRANQEAPINTVTPKTESIINPTNNTTNSTVQEVNNPTTQQQGITSEEVENIVSTTIKSLVPEMVAALNDVKVVNNNFDNSRQSEEPNRNRNITNAIFG